MGRVILPDAPGHVRMPVSSLQRTGMSRFFKLANLVFLLALIGIGVLLVWWEPVPAAQLWDWGERLASTPAILAGLLLLQAVLFTFALPGSLVFWVVAPFNPPWLSTLVMLGGSLSGAAGARYFSMYLKRRSRKENSSSAVTRLLQRRADFFTQCAIRALPGFPHSLINYAAGVLHLPLPTFVAATTAGLGIKWGVYSTAVYEATEVAEGKAALGASTFIPLAILAVLLLLGAWLRRQLARRNVTDKRQRQSQSTRDGVRRA